MTSSTPFVAIKSIQDTVYIVIRQEQLAEQLKTSNIVDILMNQEQFSGLMYALKAIERQFIEDRTQKLVNDAYLESALTVGSYVEAYDPAKPALVLNDSKRKKPKTKNTKESTS